MSSLLPYIIHNITCFFHVFFTTLHYSPAPAEESESEDSDDEKTESDENKDEEEVEGTTSISFTNT